MNLIRSFGFIGLAVMLLATGCKEGEADMPKPEPKPVEIEESIHIIPALELAELRGEEVSLGKDYETFIYKGIRVPVMPEDSRVDYKGLGYITGFGHYHISRLLSHTVAPLLFYVKKGVYLHSVTAAFDTGEKESFEIHKYGLENDLEVYQIIPTAAFNRYFKERGARVLVIKPEFEKTDKPYNNTINIKIHYPYKERQEGDQQWDQFYIQSDFPMPSKFERYMSYYIHEISRDYGEIDREFDHYQSDFISLEEGQTYFNEKGQVIYDGMFTSVINDIDDSIEVWLLEGSYVQIGEKIFSKTSEKTPTEVWDLEKVGLKDPKYGYTYRFTIVGPDDPWG